MTRYVPERFRSKGRRELDKAWRANDLEAVKRISQRELQLLMRLHGGATREEITEGEPFDDPLTF